MATAQPLSPQLVNPQLVVSQIPKKLPVTVVPLKIGLYGAQGVGKTITAALTAAALSAQFYNRAPVYVVDPDMAWQFPKRRIFEVEGIELIQRPYRSFKQMQDSFAEAMHMGACCWIVDPLTLIWTELLDTFRGKKSYISIDEWGPIKQLWNVYIQTFLDSPMNCFALGRLGNDFEEQEEKQQNGAMKTKLVKVGTKFKAGGGESFGYEPHLLLELSLERKAKLVRNQEPIKGEGRMVHRADVLKDRTWVLNGRVLRWSDKSSYKRGGFHQVWDSLKPHFAEVQATLARVQSIPGSSASLINQSGDSEFYQMRQRAEATKGEISAVMDALWGGQSADAKQMRLLIADLVFGVKSKEARDALTLEKLERGLRILHVYEKYPEHKMDSQKAVLTQLAEAIREYDSGLAEMEDLPF